MSISAKTVQELREKTGAGMMDCKKALTECTGDIEKAIALLREKGAAVLAKRDSKATQEGAVACYIHTGGKIGVMIEINCETDFVAKTDDFQALARDIAMQIAAAKPEFVSREQIPAEKIEAEREISTQWAKNQGKPEAAIPKIVDGRIEKYYETVVLLDQPFIKDQDKTISKIISEVAGKLGEKIVVRRFIRWRVGEEE